MEKKKLIIEILTSISLIGCFLNALTLVHDLYLFSNKNYFFEYLYLITLTLTTTLCLYGILSLREGKTKGFKYYLCGQIGEFLFYLFILIFATIPEYDERLYIDSYLATAGFIKNTIPLVIMTVLHYYSIKKNYFI